MKLAGTHTDAMAIRAKVDPAMKSLPPKHNIYEMDGVDDKGVIVGEMGYATVKDGKVVRVDESELDLERKQFDQNPVHRGQQGHPCWPLLFSESL